MAQVVGNRLVCDSPTGGGKEHLAFKIDRNVRLGKPKVVKGNRLFVTLQHAKKVYGFQFLAIDNGHAFAAAVQAAVSAAATAAKPARADAASALPAQEPEADPAPEPGPEPRGKLVPPPTSKPALEPPVQAATPQDPARAVQPSNTAGELIEAANEALKHAQATRGDGQLTALKHADAVLRRCLGPGSVLDNRTQAVYQKKLDAVQRLLAQKTAKAAAAAEAKKAAQAAALVRCFR